MMNAEEFKSELDKMRNLLLNVPARIDWIEARALEDVLHTLDQHRREMETAERDTPTHGSTSASDTVSQSQLDVIEKRLDTLVRFYCHHMETWHGVKVNQGDLKCQAVVNETPESPLDELADRLATRFDAIEKRLAELEQWAARAGRIREASDVPLDPMRPIGPARPKGEPFFPPADY